MMMHFFALLEINRILGDVISKIRDTFEVAADHNKMQGAPPLKPFHSLKLGPSKLSFRKRN